MATLLSTIVCQRIIIDKETNTCSYIDAIEDLGLPTMPFPFPVVSVGTVWERESDGDMITCRLHLLDPNEKQIASMVPPKQKFQGRRHRINFRLGGAQINAPGCYRIRVQQKKGGKWQTESAQPIDISLASPQKAG